MSSSSKIEWTDATWNPTTGCKKLTQGCKNCYAERDWARLSKNPDTVYYGRAFTDVALHADRLEWPLHWTKPRWIFVDSMSDLFQADVPDEFIDKVFAVMAMAKQHRFQVLTKRADRMREYFSNPIREALIGQQVGLRHLRRSGEPVVEWSGLPLPNVALGVSTEDQKTANARIPELLLTPAAVTFISAEPLLGPISFEGLFANSHDPRDGTNALEVLDWVIAGGESGPRARPSHPDWFRRLRDQCAAAGVPFFFKQWGEWEHVACVEDSRHLDNSKLRYFRDIDATFFHRGKKAAGRLLDGAEYNGMPEFPVG